MTQYPMDDPVDHGLMPMDDPMAARPAQPRTFFGFAVADSMFPRSAECTIRRRELDADTVRRVVADGVVPCLNPSHRAMIAAMRTRFGIDVPIPETPPRVALGAGDTLVVMSVCGLPRLIDRHEYTAAEIAGAEFRFSTYFVDRILIPPVPCPDGWQEFRFHSSYYGSHPERGEGDIDQMYFFRPGIDLSRWQGIAFEHGHYSKNNTYTEFSEWLNTLLEGIDFINAEDIMV